MPREGLAVVGALSVLALALPRASSAQPALPVFETQTIDDAVEIGYGVAIGDVDGDLRPDILLADKRQFVWYRNPDWQRHVLAEDQTEHDNVCIAARDIDGDGRVEIAVGAGWNPGDTVGSGALFYLEPPKDRTQPWAPVRLPHEPVVHRMRWLRLARGEFVLVVAPLHGRGNQGGEGVGARLLAYAVPDDVRAEWPTSVVEDTLHVTHNLDPAQWDPATEAEEILYLGREGGMLISHEGGAWKKRRFDGLHGGGEIRMGRHASGAPYLVTIEPFHGSQLVYYRFAEGPGHGTDAPLERVERHVLDDSLEDGHAIATGDLFGDGSDQIVAGWRRPNGEGRVGLKLYYPANPAAGEWRSILIDDAMATEDVRIGDLDGDGRPDIVAAGRASHDLEVYWNREPGSSGRP
jgi:hypothetical protein